MPIENNRATSKRIAVQERLLVTLLWFKIDMHWNRINKSFSRKMRPESIKNFTGVEKSLVATSTLVSIHWS